MWGLRLHGWLFIERARLELHRIWQPMDGCICVRWTLRGVPRFLGPVMEHGGMHLDGISEYKLDSEGLIYQHRLDNLDFDSGLRLSLAQEVLARIQSERMPAGASWGIEGTWDADVYYSEEPTPDLFAPAEAEPAPEGVPAREDRRAAPRSPQLTG